MPPAPIFLTILQCAILCPIILKSVAPEAYHRQFLTDVFPRELETIGRRRADAGMPPIAADPSTAPGVSTRHDLTGLALSGGGIRSASFGLGLLQAMSAPGVLPRVH